MSKMMEEQDKKARAMRLTQTYLEHAVQSVVQARGSSLEAGHPEVAGGLALEAEKLRDEAAELLLRAQEKLQAAAEAQHAAYELLLFPEGRPTRLQLSGKKDA
jgi:hypothetical protein